MKNSISADGSKLRVNDHICYSGALQRAIVATVCVPVAVILISYFVLRIVALKVIGFPVETTIPWMSISWGLFVILERISRKSSSRSEAAQREGIVGDTSTYEEEEQRIWIQGVERFGRSYSSCDLLDDSIYNT